MGGEAIVLARVIPSIDRLRQSPAARALEARYGEQAALSALRAAAAALRDELTGPSAEALGVSSPDDAARRIEAAAAAQLDATLRSRLRPVINATGVIVHTNLGRAPLAAAAIARITEIAADYTSLEYDLEQGRRGRRDTHAEPLLRHVTGADAALVVNNNAAATLLTLTALAQGREVIVSRGELVEIGGGFRVPDIMRQSGAVLREVGTTNRTRAADYAAAIGPRTALLLRVHPSNFTISGFTARPSLDELHEIAARHAVPLVEDLGSGLLEGMGPEALDEPTVQASLRAGVDLVAFSGDKLLGGPQAGIIVGRAALVDVLRRHPLMRALRVDKLTYAALEATLLLYARGVAAQAVPVARMLALSRDTIGQRAEAIAHALVDAGLEASVLDGESAVGGGSAPGTRLPTRLVALVAPGLSPDALLARLRMLSPPVVARIEQDRVVLDLRTVSPAADAVLAEQLTTLARQPAGSAEPGTVLRTISSD
jgi:L-seryl-tRNA(Ser) seleniumtransferase